MYLIGKQQHNAGVVSLSWTLKPQTTFISDVVVVIVVVLTKGFKEQSDIRTTEGNILRLEGRMMELWWSRVGHTAGDFVRVAGTTYRERDLSREFTAGLAR